MKPKIRIQLFSLFCGLFLLACGGGGGGGSSPPPVDPPAVADTDLDWDQGNWDEENWQ